MNTDNKRWANIALGAMLVLVGGMAVILQIFDIRVGNYLWPLFIIVPGLAFFVGMFFGGKKVSGLAIPGAIITTTGLLIFVQNLFNVWATWAYAWAFIWPISVGLGMVIHGSWGNHPKALETGTHFVKIGLLILAAGFAFFELIIGVSGWHIFGVAVNQFLWAIALIGAGAYLLVRYGVQTNNKDSGTPTPGKDD